MSTPTDPAFGVDLTGTTIGFWGLGNMGGPMTERLLAAGATVVGFDPAEAALARFVSAGGVRGTLDALAEVDVALLMLPNSDVVGQVLIDQGVAGRLRPGALVVDMSSSEPLRTKDLQERLREFDVRLVDAPVSGGVGGAVRGTLAVMAGGDPADFARAEQVLSVLGRPRLIGPVGSGHTLKALNNLLSATHLWATSEAVMAGRRFGLDPAVMLEMINGSSGRSGSTATKWPDFILPGTFDSGFGLQLMLKDMRIATDLAHRLGTPIGLGDAAVDRWAAAAAHLAPDADHTEVARFLEQEAAPATTAEEVGP